jgi:hypothetical protein
MTLDQRVEQAKAEISAMAQKARDEINIKIGWFIRSDAAKNGWIHRKRKEDAQK